MSVTRTIFRKFIRQNKYITFAPFTIRGSHYERSDKRFEGETKKYKRYGKIGTALLVSSVLIGSGITDSLDSKTKVNNKEKSSKSQRGGSVPFDAGRKRPDLPTFRADEVRQHDDRNSFWVTYKHGVYDVTSFLASHPGGEQILNAAGLSIEPFWNVYGMHKTPEVFQLLETFRIGNLHDEDVINYSVEEEEDLWAREPARDPRLIVKTVQPFNAETPPQYQIQHFDTPNSLFYVRQHMPVPELDARTHTLTVEVAGADKMAAKVTRFSLRELDDLGREEVRATLMCAGNRRSEMEKVKPVKGISWQGGAVSSARWAGVPLRTVLTRCGVDPRDLDNKHVIFEGADIDASGVNFSTSIPLRLAMSEDACVLLATHMNGAPLPPDHGRPLRVVVPGAPAIRSVKWLQRIIVSEEESPSHWHQKDYRAFNPSTTWETADFATAPPLYSLPVTSAFCDPLDGATVTVKDGSFHVRGYAYSGGGAKIVRVDVSADRGATWLRARCVAQDGAPPARHHAWTLWDCAVPSDTRQAEVQLWVKATDSNFNTQPESFEHIWNIRGILSNAYHKITVKLHHDTTK